MRKDDKVLVINKQSEFHGEVFVITNRSRKHSYSQKPLIAATHPTLGEQLFHAWELRKA